MSETKPKLGDMRLTRDGHGRYNIQEFTTNYYRPSKPPDWYTTSLYGFQGCWGDLDKAKAAFEAALKERARLAKFDQHEVISGPP